MEAILLVLVALTGAIVGFFYRKLYEILKRIEKAAKVLVQRAHKEEQKEKKMGFAEPLTMEKYSEMDDEDRLALIN